MKLLKEIFEMIDEDVGDHEEVETGVKHHEDYESRNYRQMFQAVANHFKVDPSEVDNLPEDKKKEFYNVVDHCWDPKDNKVPDTCPIDIEIE